MKKLSTIFMLLVSTLLINASEKEHILHNAFANTVAQNNYDKIDLYLSKSKIDPNGTTPLGTPFVQFIQSESVLVLFYIHGLNPNTLSDALDSFLAERTHYTNDTVAILLIALNDPKIKDIDEKRLKAIYSALKKLCTFAENDAKLMEDQMEDQMEDPTDIVKYAPHERACRNLKFELERRYSEESIKEMNTLE